VAFRLPENYPIALGQAQEQKRQQEEVPVAFGYTAGGPQRFAGERLTRPMGLDGEFGQQANRDPGFKKYLGSFVGQWTNGPFGPMTAGPSSPSEAA
jgi:hypothetical protein